MKTLSSFALALPFLALGCNDDELTRHSDPMAPSMTSPASPTTSPSSATAAPVGEGELERGATPTGGAGPGVNVGNGSNVGGGTHTGATTGNGTNVGSGGVGHGHDGTSGTGADPLGTVGGEGHGHKGFGTETRGHESTGTNVKKKAVQIQREAEKETDAAQKQVDESLNR